MVAQSFRYRDACPLLQRDQPSSPPDLTEIFEIYDNLLTGTIPEELYNLTNCLRFDVNTNGLSGTISSSIGQLSNLEFFRVSTNDFTGTIPSEVGNLNKARKYGAYHA